MNKFSEMWKDAKFVEKYNEKFPFPKDDLELFMDLLQLSETDTLIDLGSGTGEFVKATCPKVQYAIAVDESEEQMEILKNNTSYTNNVLTIESSFMKMFPIEKFIAPNIKNDFLINKLFARAALHHLTLKEKIDFFSSLKKYLAPNSRFVLFDVVFEFPKQEIHLEDRKNALLIEAANYYGDKWEIKKQDVLDTWYKEEPEDLDSWIKAFSYADFVLDKRIRRTSFISTLLFIKK